MSHSENNAEARADLNRTAMKAGLFYVISQLFVRGITFLTTPVFTRLLSKPQYSDYSRYESWLLIFAPIMSLCLWRSVERAKYDVRERFNEYCSSVQTLSYLSIGAFFLVFWTFRSFFAPLFSMTEFMLLVAFLYTFAHTSIFYFQRREKQMMRYKASTAFSAATVIPAALLAVAFVVWGKQTGREDQLVELRILGHYTPMILGGFFAAALMAVQGRKLIQIDYWKYALKFSLPLIPEVLSIQIMNQADKLMVIWLTGKENGSVFAVATQVSFIIWIIEDYVRNAWLPWMYENMAIGEEDGIENVWVILMHCFGLISLLLVMGAPEIILILGGRKYTEAIWLIAPMVTGTLFRFYSYSYTAIQNYHKKTGFVAASTVSVMFLNVILNYLFILLLGYRAAAYTTAFSYLVLLVVQALMEKRLTGRQIIPLVRTLRISFSWFAGCVCAMVLFLVPFPVRYAAAALALAAAFVYVRPRLKTIRKSLGK